jgi:hypothetical protein
VRDSINRTLHEGADDDYDPLRDVPTRVAYVGVVLDRESIDSLQRVASAKADLKGGWELSAHHCTIRMGAPKGELIGRLGERITMRTVRLTWDGMVAAVEVEMTPLPESKGGAPHVTVAVNRAAGGRPALSNALLSSPDPTGQTFIDLTISGCIVAVSDDGREGRMAAEEIARARRSVCRRTDRAGEEKIEKIAKNQFLVRPENRNA